MARHHRFSDGIRQSWSTACQSAVSSCLSERQRSSARTGGMEPGMVRKDRAPTRGSRMAVVPLPPEQSVGRYPKAQREVLGTRIPC